MKSRLSLFVLIALLLLSSAQSRACFCHYRCSFLAELDTMFSPYGPGANYWEGQVVIVKAAYIDSIPNSYSGSKLKLIRQFFGRPVKDTFNFLPLGTDCDVYLSGFHKNGQDTLFLILQREPSIRFGDTIGYSMIMCGKKYATVRNDSIIEYCGKEAIMAAAMSDSVQKRFQGVGVDILSAAPKIKIFPNPAINQLTITGAVGAKVLLCNGLGQKVMQFSVTMDKQMMDVRMLPAGMYLLYITNEKGGRIVFKMLKE